MCGQPPLQLSYAFQQVFCENEYCGVLCWDPWQTAFVNLQNMGEVVITSAQDASEPAPPTAPSD
jgi:secreted PhoX family phosphatase